MGDINWYRLDLKQVNASDIDSIIDAGIAGFESKSKHSVFISQNLIKILAPHSIFFEEPTTLFQKQFDTLQRLVSIQKTSTYEVPGLELGAMNSISNTILKLCEFSYSLLIGLNYHNDHDKTKELTDLLLGALQFNQTYELLNSDKVNLPFNGVTLTIAVSDIDSLKIYGILKALETFVIEI